MITKNCWHTEDFDSLFWHDVHIHGFSLDSFIYDEGAADLVLDIDYILNWENVNNKLLFTVCRATLRFHKIFDLRFMLDYVTPTMGMFPFSIDNIQRDLLPSPTGYEFFHWSIKINSPEGYIEFDSPGFKLTLIGSPIVQQSQWLSSEQRDDCEPTNHSTTDAVTARDS